MREWLQRKQLGWCLIVPALFLIRQTLPSGNYAEEVDDTQVRWGKYLNIFIIITPASRCYARQRIVH